MRHTGVLLAATLLVAATLRSALTSLSPLLDPIRAGLGLSAGETALLTSMPVLLFGLGAPVALVLARRTSLTTAITIGGIVLVLGMSVRFGPGPMWMFVGTGLVGAGIAIGNVLMPAFIKLRFPTRIATVMALFTAAMNLSAALAAGTAVPLSDALGFGWRGGLLPCFAIAAAAVLTWLIANRRSRPAAGAVPDRRRTDTVRRLLRSRRAWSVVAFTGSQSVVYYALLAWLPTIYDDHGSTPASAGLLLSVTTLVSAPAAIFVSSIGVRRVDQRTLVAWVAGCAGLGLMGLLLAAGSVPILWAALLGIGQGGSFALTLTFFVVRTATSEQTASLSMLAQGLGYVIAACGPIITRLLRAATGSWSAALWFLVAMVVIQLATGLAAARPGSVLTHPVADPRPDYPILVPDPVEARC